MLRRTVGLYLAERTIYLEAVLTHSGYQGDRRPPGHPADPWELESARAWVCTVHRRPGETPADVHERFREPLLGTEAAEALAVCWWDELVDQAEQAEHGTWGER